MLDLPLSPSFNLVGGARFESTEISVVVYPEEDVLWFPPGGFGPSDLLPGDADVDFEQDDVLPALALVYEPHDQVTLRAAYGETVARQTFKELTPIIQQEFLGGPIFIGNPFLEMSTIENYDFRVDYVPYGGSLVSASVFRKDLENPIEYVQKVEFFDYTTAVNYPTGELSGLELELRQHLGHFWEAVEGLSLGLNATFLESEVTLPDDEVAGFEDPSIAAPMTTREMTGAPQFLFNLYSTYDLASTGTQLGLFYTVQGDTLVAGAGQSDGNFIPSLYATQFDTLNMTVTQNLGRFFRLFFQAKNLTNPEIQTVYRSEFIGDDVLHTSKTLGVELSIGIGAEFGF